MGKSGGAADNEGLKKGPWTQKEDQKLLAYILQNGHGSWRSLPAKAGTYIPNKVYIQRRLSHLFVIVSSPRSSTSQVAR